MALFLTVVVVLTCFGGLASPNPVPSSSSLKELIEELVNITQNQKVSACGPSSEGAGVRGSQGRSPEDCKVSLVLRERSQARGEVKQYGWTHEGIPQSPRDHLLPWPGPACRGQLLLSGFGTEERREELAPS